MMLTVIYNDVFLIALNILRSFLGAIYKAGSYRLCVSVSTHLMSMKMFTQHTNTNDMFKCTLYTAINHWTSPRLNTTHTLVFEDQVISLTTVCLVLPSDKCETNIRYPKQYSLTSVSEQIQY